MLYVERGREVEAIRFDGRDDRATWGTFVAWCVDRGILVSIGKDYGVNVEPVPLPLPKIVEYVQVEHSRIEVGSYVVKVSGPYARTEILSASEFEAKYVAVGESTDDAGEPSLMALSVRVEGTEIPVRVTDVGLFLSEPTTSEGSEP